MMNLALGEALKSLPGIDSAHLLSVLQCSSTLATGALVFHVYVVGEKFSRYVVKTPRYPQSDHQLEAEWKNLDRIRASGTDPEFLLEQVRSFELDGVPFYAYRTFPGHSMFALCRDRLLLPKSVMIRRFAKQRLPVAQGLHRLDTQSASADAMAEDLHSDLAQLRELTPSLPAKIVANTVSSAKILEQATDGFPLGLIHGDFSPYNMIVANTRANSVGLIDWEHSETGRPQVLDILRFISACTLIDARRYDRTTALQAMSRADNPLINSLLLPWLETFAPGSGEVLRKAGVLQSLWQMYWLHAALHEQKRRTEPNDFIASYYLPGMVGLLGA